MLNLPDPHPPILNSHKESSTSLLLEAIFNQEHLQSEVTSENH